MDKLEKETRQSLIKDFCKKTFNVEITKVISTYTSEVFISESLVFKRYYQLDNYFFGKLSDVIEYSKFVRKDFDVNKVCAPAVLQNIITLKFENGVLKLSSEQEANEFWITMCNISGYKTVTECLTEDSLAEKDFYRLGQESAALIQKFSSTFMADFTDKLDLGWHNLMLSRIDDLEFFANSFTEDIRKEAEIVIGSMKVFLDVNKEYFINNKIKLNLAIDNHTDNIYFKDVEFIYLDIMLPNRNWVVVDDVYNVARVAADIFCITQNREYIDSLTDGYATLTKTSFDENIFKFYMYYTAYIRRLFFWNYKQFDLSEKYKQGTFELMSKIA